MTNEKIGIMIIISSPSGAGKTTLANALIQSDSHTKLSISVTTRTPRKNEINGKDYHFISHEEYKKLKSTNMLIEDAEVFGNHYGTLKEDTENTINSGIDMVYDIDWQGAKQLKEKYPDNTVSIFIMPPSIEVLEQRLRNRGTDDDLTIQKRLDAAEVEISKSSNYDYILTNNEVRETLKEIKDIVAKERKKRLQTNTN